MKPITVLFPTNPRRVETMNIWNLVISDMKHRDDMGTAKYGNPLTLHDGRRTLQDAYEEALDMAVYLKKAILEEDEKQANMCICGHKSQAHDACGCTWTVCNCSQFTEANY
jgi:hypothetical protein